MTDWNEVGTRAYNRCFNNYRKTEDIDESFECYDEEIIEKIEDAGIDYDEGWEFDLSSDQISEIISGTVKQYNEHKNDNLVGPLHTFLIDKLYEAKEKHGEDKFNSWNKLLDDMLN